MSSLVAIAALLLGAQSQRIRRSLAGHIHFAERRTACAVGDVAQTLGVAVLADERAILAVPLVFSVLLVLFVLKGKRYLAACG